MNWWWRLLALAGLLAVAYWPVARWLEARRFGAARAAEQAGDLTEAKALLDRYLRDRPGDPEARLLAARVGWRSKLGGPLEAGWDRPLREHLKHAEQVPGLSHRASLESAVLDLLGGDLREAGARVRSRVRDDEPNVVALLEALARAHLDSHHLADAADYAGAILRHRPDHALAHFWRGLATELSGRRLGERGRWIHCRN